MQVYILCVIMCIYVWKGKKDSVYAKRNECSREYAHAYNFLHYMSQITIFLPKASMPTLLVH